MSDAAKPNLRGIADKIAWSFHWEYERMAVRNGWATQEKTQVPWDELPEANRKTMIDTVNFLLDTGVIAPGTGMDLR